MGMRKKTQRRMQAKIKSDEAGNSLERINNHTHAPSETKCEIAKVRANIKRRATKTQDPAQVSYIRNRTWRDIGSSSH